VGRTEELVWVDTEDGIRHDGVVIRPTGTPSGTVVVWMHGFTGHFSEPHQITIGRYLAERGHILVSGDNRGHHLGANIGCWGSPARLGGAWWELVSESDKDIRAWLDYAEKTLAPRRLVLAGHSYGGMKVVWYQGTHTDPRLAGLISASGGMRPPSRRAELAEKPLSLARKMVAEGRGLELLPFETIGRPGQTLSAQTVVDRAESIVDVYGLDGGADPPVSKIRCPLLAILGTAEPEIGSPADLETVKRNARSSSHVETALIEGADHVYTTTAEDVARAIEGFLGRLA
jgi:pimeloyl-ACP methyl ester carboxylesterase